MILFDSLFVLICLSFSDLVQPFTLGLLPLCSFSEFFGLWAALCAQQVVCPSEGARVVTDEKVVVVVMVVRTCPERKELVQGPWEIVAGMGVYGLEQTEGDPQRQRKQVQVGKIELGIVLGEPSVDDGEAHGTEAECHNFNRVGIFGCQTKWSGVSVVLFVDVLVKQTPVEHSVGPVMPLVFEHEEECDLGQHNFDQREGNCYRDLELGAERVEQPDGQRLHHEMQLDHRFEALPLLAIQRKLGRLDFPLAEIGYSVYDNPR